VLEAGCCHRCLEIVCSCVSRNSGPVKTAELIEMLFGRQIHAGPKNLVLDAGNYGRHLADMIE